MTNLAAAIVVGFLSAYAQTPTDATLQVRQEWGHIPANLERYDGYVAVLDCGRIGQTAILDVGGKRLTMLVFDCAGPPPGGSQWMRENRIVAEIDWYTWQRWPWLIGRQATLEYLEGKTWGK